MKTKRLGSLLLALTILFSCFPAIGFAEEDLNGFIVQEETIENSTESSILKEIEEIPLKNDNLEIKGNLELRNDPSILEEATTAVENAENASGKEKPGLINIAKEKVNLLEPGTKKDELTKRISQIDITFQNLTFTWKNKNGEQEKILFDAENGPKEYDNSYKNEPVTLEDPDTIDLKYSLANPEATIEINRKHMENSSFVRFDIQVTPKNQGKAFAYQVYIYYKKPEIIQEDKVNEIIDILSKKYKGTYSDWFALSLSALNKQEDVNHAKLISIAKKVIAENKTPTDLERVTISLTSLGYDVTDMLDANGKRVNVINMIANYTKGLYGDGLGTLNGYIFALIAYDSGQYDVPKNAKWTRDDIITYILEHQLGSGGWNINNEEPSDVDTTAMAIQALAPYQERADVKKAIDKGLDWLSKTQTASGNHQGGFGGFSAATNSNSTAMVVLALTNLGLNPDTDSRFIKGDKSLIDGLLSFVTGTNNFGYTNNTHPDEKATEQGFQALIAYRDMKNIYLFPKPTKSIDNIVTPVSLNIIQFPKLEYIVGDKLDFANLRAKVKFSDGSEQIINYPDLEISPVSTETSGKILVHVGYLGITDRFYINVKEKTIIPDIPVNPQDPVNPTPTQKQAYISVVVPPGPTVMTSGKIMQPKKAFTIIEGKDTAFSMLQKTGLDYNYNYHPVYDGVYVSSIEGLSEFDGGPNSGWMYRVNGVFPSYSSSLYKVKEGDYVEWLYTRDLGKDIGGYVEGVENDSQGKKVKFIISKTSEGGSIVPHGKVKVTEKEPIIFTMTPDQGFLLFDVELDGKSVGPISKFTATIDNINNNSVIKAIFKRELDLTEEEKQELERKRAEAEKNQEITGEIVRLHFKDIENHWALNSIKYVVDKGYFIGISDKEFGPNLQMTRGMFITVLGRMSNISYKNNNIPFKDVKASDYFAPYLKWGYDNKIIKGVGFNKFEPNRPITREEMAKMINAYLKVRNVEITKIKSQEVKDLNTVSSWAKKDVEELYQGGILKGRENGKFHPKDLSTRAEVATIIERIDKLK